MVRANFLISSFNTNLHRQLVATVSRYHNLEVVYGAKRPGFGGSHVSLDILLSALLPLPTDERKELGDACSPEWCNLL